MSGCRARSFLHHRDAQLGPVDLRHVEPQRHERAVVRHQLGHLLLQVGVVGLEVRVRLLGPSRRGCRAGRRGGASRRPSSRCRRRCPSLRQAALSSFSTSRPNGRGHDVVVGCRAVPQAEAVVVLGGDHQVLHPRGLGGARPRVGVELLRVEALVEVVVFLDRDLPPPRPADLGALQAHRPPVDEHPEAHVLPLGNRLGRRGAGILSKGAGTHPQRGTNQEQSNFHQYVQWPDEITDTMPPPCRVSTPATTA